MTDELRRLEQRQIELLRLMRQAHTYNDVSLLEASEAEYRANARRMVQLYNMTDTNEHPTTEGTS